ncbi:hypothetical protein ACS22S_28115, partial [Klebsiella pneumoniae]|uniref:hypothetical protein n=1 Tax=Klebsiella pneumoniae TaxID=573 RepID=UPI003F217CE5
TGATTVRIVRELDAGPVFGVMTERVRPRDTAGDLLGRLAEGGAELTAGRERVAATGDELGGRLRLLVGKPGLDGHS